MTNLLQIFRVESRSIFGKDMDNSLQLTFWPTLYTAALQHIRALATFEVSRCCRWS